MSTPSSLQTGVVVTNTLFYENAAVNNRCSHCHRYKFEKGAGNCGHLHCRGCPTANEIRLGLPPEAWIVLCGKRREEICTKPLTVREEPAPFEVPIDLFHKGCRMIEIIVGGQDYKQTFTAHAPILLNASAYFVRALKDTFKEGQTNRVELEDESPFYFGMVLEYLYLGRIREAVGKHTVVTPHTNPSMNELFEVWLLAHYLQIPTLLNYAPYCLLKRWDEGGFNRIFLQHTGRLEELYERSPMDSMMRKFLVDLLVWGDNRELKFSDNPPPLMMRDGWAEMKRRCDGKARSPLLDAKNYFTDEKMLASVKQGKKV